MRTSTDKWCKVRCAVVAGSVVFAVSILMLSWCLLVVLALLSLSLLQHAADFAERMMMGDFEAIVDLARMDS